MEDQIEFEKFEKFEEFENFEDFEEVKYDEIIKNNEQDNKIMR